MVYNVLLHPKILQQSCKLRCLSCLHRNGFLAVVGLHFIFRNGIQGEFLEDFHLSGRISNFELCRIVNKIANIHQVPVAKLLNVLFEVLDHFRVNKQLLRDRCHVSVGDANSAMVKALGDCFLIHIHGAGCNSNMHSLDHVDLLGIFYLF